MLPCSKHTDERASAWKSIKLFAFRSETNSPCYHTKEDLSFHIKWTGPIREEHFNTSGFKGKIHDSGKRLLIFELNLTDGWDCLWLGSSHYVCFHLQSQDCVHFFNAHTKWTARSNELNLTEGYSIRIADQPFIW